MSDTTLNVLVVGAGIMGAGIAQVAASAGHAVLLFDARPAAAQDALARLAGGLDALVGKGRISAEAAQATVARIRPVGSLDAAREAGLVVEAIVEDLEAKRRLLAELEGLVADDCILASNTSSISVTALSRGLQRPSRFVGMHFFNPVPVMKLVEVVSGLHTEASVAGRVFELAKRWGKVPVHARSTPGFIVNRIARPFYAETLALLQERAAGPGVIDACLRAAGFRMGACELMDLIGHDTNFAVTRSVFEANFGDKRFAPSLVQQEMVDGGLLGRKSGRGFYAPGDAVAPLEEPRMEPLPSANRIVLHGRGPLVERWAAAFEAQGRDVRQRRDSGWSGLEIDGGQLRPSDGRPASQVAAEEGIADLAVHDRPFGEAGALAWAASGRAGEAFIADVPRWLAAAGHAPVRIGDAAGLVVGRTIAMLINEASDAVLQGVCDEAGADAAMKLGVNYPAGPFQWLNQWNAGEVVALLDHLDAHYRGERYRASPGLRQRAWAEEVRP